MNEIPIYSKGVIVSFAVVDKGDFEYLSAFKWYLHSKGYAYRKYSVGGKRTTLLMHRQIMEMDSDLIVDHINGNRLDNRRSNLRVCSRSDNNRNKSKRIKLLPQKYIMKLPKLNLANLQS